MNQEAFTDLGFLFREQPVQDYGIDAHVEIVENDAATGQLFGLQIKTGRSWFEEETPEGYVFRSDNEHVEYWLGHSLPVVVTLCDPRNRDIHWQLVSVDTVESTGTGWKLVVPRSQLVNEQSVEKLTQIAARVVPAYRYTILCQEDVSWAGAKRYSLDVLLNGTLSKAEIAQVIRQVVIEHVGSRYYRSPLVETHWGDSDAHAIFLFVYLTLDDRRDANWICRSLWIDENLPERNAPIRFRGENIGASIITEWSSRYSSSADFYRAKTLNKADYLRTADCFLESLCPLVDQIISALEHERRNSAFSADRLLKDLEPRISEIYSDGTNLGFPPVECREVDLKLQNVLAAAHNLVLPFLDAVTDKARNRWLENRTVEDYLEQLAYLRYELDKVR